jgi:hypothetical protein
MIIFVAKKATVTAFSKAGGATVRIFKKEQFWLKNLIVYVLIICQIVTIQIIFFLLKKVKKNFFVQKNSDFFAFFSLV